MKITDKRDGETVQTAGPTRQCNLFTNQPRTVGLDDSRIGGNRPGPNSGYPFDELTPVDRRKSQSFGSLTQPSLTPLLCLFRITRERELRICGFGFGRSPAPGNGWHALRDLRDLAKPGFIAQKLKVACRSIRRTALPVENGPPCNPFGTLKKLDPRTPLGFAVFTLLKTLRAVTPNVRL